MTSNDIRPTICIQLSNLPTCVIMWPTFSKIQCFKRFHNLTSDDLRLPLTFKLRITIVPFTPLMIISNSHFNQTKALGVVTFLVISQFDHWWPQMTSDLLFAYNYQICQTCMIMWPTFSKIHSVLMDFTIWPLMTSNDLSPLNKEQLLCPSPH